jgi:SAM-dependent MidA family methyltransferase
MITAIDHHLATEGLISFSEFMRLALYDPREGYYAAAREKFGAAGDFYTASQVDELFGALLANEFAAIWRSLGEPANFTIIELGAGRGEFAADALGALGKQYPACFQAARYAICEISAHLRREQQAQLKEFSSRVCWVDNLNELAAPVEGVVFSNEFFDALPVHLVRQCGGRLRELYVERDAAGRLRFCEGELSSQALDDYWQRAGAPLAEGQLAEISLEAVEWVAQIARVLARGRVITIDYGDAAERLYTPDRREGTLRCFYHHTLNREPLERIGEQDMTSSVNFTALIEYGRAAGLHPLSFTRQNDYLIGLGLLERAAELAGQVEGESPLSLQRRLALKNLFVPQGIAGYFKVLVQERV